MRRISYLCLFLGIMEARLSRAEPSSEVDLGEVVVEGTSEKTTAKKDPSAFVTVIDPKETQGQFQSTAELLQKTVGVKIIDLGGLGQQQTLSIRGSSAEQVVVLLDGVRLNSAQKGGVDIASIPLDIIDHIEVIRGGESAVFGSDALGGVVNIVTKKGEKTKEGKPTLDLLGSYGSFQTGKGAVSIGQKIKNFDYFFSHTHLSTEGDFPFLDTNGQEARRINNESISEAPFVRLGYDVENIGRFEMSDQFYWAERGQPGFGQAQLAFAESEEFRNLWSGSFERKKFVLDEMDLRTSVFYRLEDFEFNDPQPQIGPAIASDTRNQAYGGDIRLQYAWEPFQLLTLAMEMREDEANVFSNSAAANNFQDFSVDRFSYAFVLKDELQFFDEQVALIPTLRYEDSTQFQGQVVPKLGARLRTWKWLTFKGNISRIFRIPNFNELYFPESEFIGGNPNLRPEEGYSGDVGFEVSTKFFDFGVAGFYSELEQAIFFVPISATRIEPLNFQDDSISQGFEITAEWRPIQYFSQSVNYTLLDAFFESTGFRLPGRSLHHVNFRSVVQYPPWVRVYVEGEYLSEFSVVLPAAGGQLEPERVVINSGVSVTPMEMLTVSFDAKDINNERGMNDARDFPLPERRFMGTVQLNF